MSALFLSALVNRRRTAKSAFSCGAVTLIKVSLVKVEILMK